MKIRMLVLFLCTLLVVGVLGCASWTKRTTVEVPRMEPEELMARLDDPTLVIVDFRVGNDWKASSLKIKGAIRESDDIVSNFPSKYFPPYPKDKPIVLYCA